MLLRSKLVESGSLSWEGVIELTIFSSETGDIEYSRQEI